MSIYLSQCTHHDRHFGKEIIANRLQTRQDDPKIETLWLKLYREFIEAIDAIDNGISQYATDLQPKYRIRTDVSARVGYFNPAWNEPADAQTVDVRTTPEFMFDHVKLTIGSFRQSSSRPLPWWERSSWIGSTTTPRRGFRRATWSSMPSRSASGWTSRAGSSCSSSSPLGRYHISHLSLHLQSLTSVAAGAPVRA